MKGKSRTVAEGCATWLAVIGRVQTELVTSHVAWLHVAAFLFVTFKIIGFFITGGSVSYSFVRGSDAIPEAQLLDEPNLYHSERKSSSN